MFQSDHLHGGLGPLPSTTRCIRFRRGLWGGSSLAATASEAAEDVRPSGEDLVLSACQVPILSADLLHVVVVGVWPSSLDPILSVGKDPVISPALDFLVPSDLVVGLLNLVSPSEKVGVDSFDPPIS